MLFHWSLLICVYYTGTSQHSYDQQRLKKKQLKIYDAFHKTPLLSPQKVAQLNLTSYIYSF